MDVYDVSLTRTTASNLSVARCFYGTATTLENYALFDGSGSTYVVDAYDTSLTRSNDVSLSIKNSGLEAGTIGNYALFAGGGSNKVDAITIF